MAAEARSAFLSVIVPGLKQFLAYCNFRAPPPPQYPGNKYISKPMSHNKDKEVDECREAWAQKGL